MKYDDYRDTPSESWLSSSMACNIISQNSIINLQTSLKTIVVRKLHETRRNSVHQYWLSLHKERLKRSCAGLRGP